MNKISLFLLLFLCSCSYENFELKNIKKELTLPPCTCSTIVDIYTPDSNLGTVFNVDDYGAVGNGIVDDSDSIQSAIAAAGSNNTIHFTSGKTYSICKTVAGISGQFFTSSSILPATIKRCNEKKSALTSTVTTSTTTFTVSSGSLFSIGQQVTFVKNVALPGHDDGDIQTNWVTAINGNQITVSKSPLTQFNIGDFLVTNFPMVTVTGSAKVTRLIFDGNKSTNNFYIGWEYQQSLVDSTATNSVIERNIFANSQGESVYLNGGTNMIVKKNLFIDSNGSGVHLSSAVSPILEQNTFLRTNLQSDRLQHSEASITWSFSNTSVTAILNCFDTVSKFAMGRMVLSTGNDGAFISDNTVCNSNGIFDLKGGGTSYPSSGLPANVVFSNNLAVNGRSITLYEYTGKMRNVEVSNNIIWNGYISATGIDNLLIESNVINMLNTSYDDGQQIDGSVGSIGVLSSNDVIIYNNELNLGRKGIYIAPYSPLSFGDLSNILIFDNIVKDQTVSALMIGNRSLTWYENPSNWQTEYANMRDIHISHNIFSSSSMSDPNSSYNTLIHLGKGRTYHGPLFEHNCVDSPQFGIFLDGHLSSTSYRSILVRNNTIMSFYSNFRSWGGGYNKDLVIRNNILDQSINSSYTSESTNEIMFNIINSSLISCENFF